jgi:competence protein ComEA
MSSDKMDRIWLLAAGLLILIIVISSIIIWINRDSARLLTITPPLTSRFQGEIYIDGAVSNPGSYQLTPGDSLDSLIQASGGTTDQADLSWICLHIPVAGGHLQAQKININQAETWLLQALPGIGEVRAQAIIDYRQQNGLYHDLEDLLQVPGISSSVFAKIRDFITITD